MTIPSHTPATRAIIVAIASGIVAAILGWQIAEENYILLALMSVAVLALVLGALGSGPPWAVFLGALLLGYMVGNRGFAQVMPLPGIPLLPAEIFLVAGVSWLFWQGVRSGLLPLQRDALNVGVLLWFVIGSSRISIDVRVHGFLALRDFATVYYAAFFFIAQRLATHTKHRKTVVWFLVASSILQPPIYLLTEAFPAFFFETLVFRGAPLVYFKGDLALTFTAVSSMLLALAGPRRWCRWSWPVASIEMLAVIAGENRASMLAALSAMIWLAFSCARRVAAIQLGSLVAAFVVVLGLSLVTGNPWAEKRIADATERLVSIGDFAGDGSYRSAESNIKGDNNRFRSLWWREVVGETTREAPWFGLGFGHDLAREFLRVFSPGAGEDFSARSPHSIVITVFGRMGLAGLLPFLLICAGLTIRLARSLQADKADWTRLGLWLTAWIILVSSLFGVVLEGPMGAALFWSVAGLANGWPISTEVIPELPAPQKNPRPPPAA